MRHNCSVNGPSRCLLTYISGPKCRAFSEVRPSSPYCREAKRPQGQFRTLKFGWRRIEMDAVTVMHDEVNLSPLGCRKNGKVIFQIPGECASVEDILSFLPELNMHGFRCYGRVGSITDAEHAKLRDNLRDREALGGLSTTTLTCLNGWLSSFDRSRRWQQDSYALKHTFERETGKYMMNGAFIVAVLMAGFEIKIAAPNALMKMQRPAR
jgi:hypothetical protein